MINPFYVVQRVSRIQDHGPYGGYLVVNIYAFKRAQSFEKVRRTPSAGCCARMGCFSKIEFFKLLSCRCWTSRVKFRSTPRIFFQSLKRLSTPAMRSFCGSLLAMALMPSASGEWLLWLAIAAKETMAQLKFM